MSDGRIAIGAVGGNLSKHDGHGDADSAIACDPSALTRAQTCAMLCYMRSITVREAQHNLAKVLHEVESGWTVQILRRKKPVARLVPVHSSGVMQEPTDWEGHERRMATVWGGRSVEGVDAVLDDLRGGR